MKTVRDCLKLAQSPLEGELLLCHVLQKDKLFIYLNLDLKLTDSVYQTYSTLIKRRQNHEPVAYLLGKAEFCGRWFKVSPDVLIPRPETELLVEHALKSIPKDHPQTLIDVCTGSGILAITLAAELPHAQVFATDISQNALEIAKKNAQLHQANINFIQSDLLKNLLNKGIGADLILANPPYIKPKDMAKLMPDVRHYEPHLALEGIEEDGLGLHRELLKQSTSLLKPGGLLLMEIGYDQQEDVQTMTHEGFLGPQLHLDAFGNPRMVVYTKKLNFCINHCKKPQNQASTGDKLHF